MKGIGMADLHVHTHHSDGEDSPGEVVAHARDQGLQVIAITDHDRIDGALIAVAKNRGERGLEVIVGEEVSTRDGHVIGLFLREPIAAGMSAGDTVNAIHHQSGVAIAAHPYWRTRARVKGRFPHGVGDLIADAGFDAVEVLNGGFTPSMVYANVLAGWANRHLGLAEIGGSDAHVKQAIGCAVTQFEGRTAADLRHALLAGRTSARMRRPSAIAVGRYVAWGLTPRSRPIPETV
jgi:predicted metal-dependent phosphoesterase TrpH